MTLTEVHELITSTTYKATTDFARTQPKTVYKYYKAENFDYVTFMGVFSRRQDKDLKTPSGLFVIDLDKLGAEPMKKIAEQLKQDTVLMPQLIFTSPSGDGLKVVLAIDFSLIDTTTKGNIMLPYWNAVNSYLEAHYSGLIEPTAKGEYMDKACTDLSRACFICHDANAYLNINDTVLDAEFIEQYKPIETAKPTKKSKQELQVRVNPATTLKDLADRHLLASDNRTTDLLPFINAAKAIGSSESELKVYISERVHIADDSSKASDEGLTKLIKDLYERYPVSDGEAVYHTPLLFTYRLLKFKYAKDAGGFIPYELCSIYVDKVLTEQGFFLRKIGEDFIYIRQQGCIIKPVTPKEMRLFFREFVKTFKDGYQFTYQNEPYYVPYEAISEIYLKQSQLFFNDKWLPNLPLHAEPLLKDTEYKSHFCFKNYLVTVTADKLNVELLKGLQGDFCIWDSQVVQRNLTYSENYKNAQFYKFLRNLSKDNDKRFLTLATGIGYAINHSHSPSRCPAVVLLDETITEAGESNGGSGKGLIVHATEQLRNLALIDGKQYESGKSFSFSLINAATQIVVFEDVSDKFNLTDLYSCLTEGFTTENKFVDKVKIPAKDNPKTIITSNQVLKGMGLSDIRRTFNVELSDHYSRQIITGAERPIIEEHGGTFFSDEDWNEDEWNGFYSTMIFCSILFHKHGLQYSKGVNIERNRFRQSTSTDFVEWTEEKNLEPNKWCETKPLYLHFVSTYYGEQNPKMQMKDFSKMMKQYAQYKGYKYERKDGGGKSVFILNQ